MTQVNDWKAILIDGVVYEKRSDGSLAPAPERMDFDKIDSLSEVEIEAAASADEDGHPAPDNDWAEGLKNRKKRLEVLSPKTRLG